MDWLQSDSVWNLYTGMYLVRPVNEFTIDQICCQSVNHPYWHISFQVIPSCNGQITRISACFPDPDQIVQHITKKEKIDQRTLKCLEPTMDQKLWIMTHFGRKVYSILRNQTGILAQTGTLAQIGTFAVEVYPTKHLLVDDTGMYHWWVLEAGEKFFPFSIQQIYEKTYTWNTDQDLGLSYFFTQKAGVTFLYLKSKNSMSWSQKQKAKETLLGDCQAFEVISQRMAVKPYSCLIVPKKEYVLPFGLKLP